jgi:hypothetical protein
MGNKITRGEEREKTNNILFLQGLCQLLRRGLRHLPHHPRDALQARSVKQSIAPKDEPPGWVHGGGRGRGGGDHGCRDVGVGDDCGRKKFVSEGPGDRQLTLLRVRKLNPGECRKEVKRRMKGGGKEEERKRKGRIEGIGRKA